MRQSQTSLLELRRREARAGEGSGEKLVINLVSPELLYDFGQLMRRLQSPVPYLHMDVLRAEDESEEAAQPSPPPPEPPLPPPEAAEQRLDGADDGDVLLDLDAEFGLDTEREPEPFHEVKEGYEGIPLSRAHEEEDELFRAANRLVSSRMPPQADSTQRSDL